MIEQGPIETADASPRTSLIAAHIVSFLAILCLFVNFYMFLVLNRFFTLVPRWNIPGSLIALVGLFSFLGVFVSSLLCPLFLPSPRNPWLHNPPGPVTSAVFILLVVLPNVVLRSLGVERWVNSLLTIGITQMLSGMLYPICLGLFLQTHIVPGGGNENRTGKFCAFFFALALSGGIFSRHIFLSLQRRFNITWGPEQAIAIAYNLITWLIACIGVLAIIWTVLQKNAARTQALPDGSHPVTKTNWPIILRLIGLAIIFKSLNSVMEMRLFPRINYSAQSFDLHLFIQGIAVPIIALFSHRSKNRFYKVFIPASMSLFILFPCLLFFEDYPRFILFIDIMLGVFNLLIWVIFTVTLIENYSGGFWFYGLAAAIHFTNIFSFISPMVIRFVPAGTGNIVLISGIFSVLFLILSLRILFAKNEPGLISASARSGRPGSLEEVFRQHGLTKREIQIAALVVEGHDNDEIARRIFRATVTIKTHLTTIYRKFGVKGRAEFMAIVLKEKI